MSKSSSAVTYKALLDDARRLLCATSDSPKIDAEVLLLHVLQQPLAWLICYGHTAANSSQIRHYFDLIGKRQQGQPIAYLIGHKEFWSLKLVVNEHVLIPRADTETLVEQALIRLPEKKAQQVLDLGTGSGAIALSIAKERPLTQVLATDAHVAALSVASSNAKLHGLENVDFAQSSWFDKIDGAQFDLIAANPPYINAQDAHLKRGDLRFEPDSALIAGGDGLADLAQIITQSPQYLNQQGWLMLEHGYDQQAQVQTLFENAGFINIECHHDLNKLPRCTSGHRP